MSLKKQLIFFMVWTSASLLTKPLLYIDSGAEKGYGGRVIGSAFERSITQTIVNTLVNRLKKMAYDIESITSPNSNAWANQHQKASYINQLQINYYIRIHCYEIAPDENVRLNFYYYSRDSFAEKISSGSSAVLFISYEDVYKKWLQKTKLFVEDLYLTLKNSFFEKHLMIAKPQAAPLTSLMGINAPALVIELGLPHPTSWEGYIDTFVEAMALHLKKSFKK